MNIECTTQYDIGQSVYLITEEPSTNDWFCDWSKWYVYNTRYDLEYRAIAREVKQVRLVVYINEGKLITNVEYSFREPWSTTQTWYKSENIFSTLEEAQVECDRRNKKKEW
jgi:hypothetical protein